MPDLHRRYCDVQREVELRKFEIGRAALRPCALKGTTVCAACATAQTPITSSTGNYELPRNSEVIQDDLPVNFYPYAIFITLSDNNPIHALLTRAANETMLTIKQLEALRAVTSLGSIASAAQALHTSESAISKRLKELEEALGEDLFDRHARALRLNQIGLEVLRLGEDLLVLRDQILRTGNGRSYSTRTLKFGMTELIAARYLTEIVDSMRRSYPLLTLEPKIGMTFDLAKDLEEGTLDMAFIPTSMIQKTMMQVHLFNLHHVWVCNASQAESDDQISLDELAEMPLLLQPMTSPLTTTIMKTFRGIDHSPTKLITCNSTDALKQLAMAGFGVAPLPVDFCEKEISTGALRVLNVSPPIAPVSYGSVKGVMTDKKFFENLTDLIKHVF